VQVSVWKLWFKKEISPGHIWTTLYIHKLQFNDNQGQSSGYMVQLI